MMKFFRKLRGTSKREAEAEKLAKDHHREASQEISSLSEKVVAVEKLVRGLKKDTAQWSHY